ncbi:acetyltransferase [Pelomonas sp. Root1217]|uniref:GNAT family N-acetyltransferase n=1 Tax=Pelomonas sp. Root1217 TaxID=1736430 RepID=UPI00070D0928|nr:GNAT family N-acetyltransferase [Pelomonas sp. Root1217]KQV50347.1 acetyltransferase [Pelomonas sp. Root1217]
MSILFRPATAADAPACVTLRGLTRENAISVAQLAAMGITAESWASAVADGALPGFICTDEAAIVGYCFGDKASGEVVVLALLPQYEGRGIGKELLNLVVDLLVEAGHQRLFLGCSPDPAVRSYSFYRQQGWVSTGSFDRAGDEVLELLVGNS